jgi:hypothetical protein
LSNLDFERSAVKKTIEINPSTITISRPDVSQNDRGVDYIDWSSPSSIPLTNPIRVVLNISKGQKILEKTGEYQNIKTHFIISDYETEIKKHDRFTDNGITWELQDIEIVRFLGEIRNYQAELKDITEKIA